MPLIKTEKVYPDVYVGLWQISETESDFYGEYPFLLKYRCSVDGLASASRKLEFLAVRALLPHIDILDADVSIAYEKSGKPLLSNGFNISISHTRGYAAVIISAKRRVAVDIEYVSERVGRIATRFLRADEKTVNLQQQLMCWCAKETAYKLFPYEDFSFSDIRVSVEAMDGKAGTVPVENIKHFVKFDVSYVLTDDFMLTYAVV